MKYLPFKNIIYKTKLSSEEVLNRLDKSVTKHFRRSDTVAHEHKLFEGIIDGKSFKIQRIIGYRNSFLPQIIGHIENDRFETRISIRMKPHISILVFMTFYFVFIAIGLVALISYSINSGEIKPFIFLPVGMFLFGYGLIVGGFKYESKKSKKQLLKLFEVIPL